MVQDNLYRIGTKKSRSKVSVDFESEKVGAKKSMQFNRTTVDDYKGYIGRLTNDNL